MKYGSYNRELKIKIDFAYVGCPISITQNRPYVPIGDIYIAVELRTQAFQSRLRRPEWCTDVGAINVNQLRATYTSHAA